MLRKFAIFGLVLLIAGVAMLTWVLADQKKQEQLIREQQEEMEWNLSKVDKLVAGEEDVDPSVNISSGEKLQKQLDKHKSLNELREITVTISILCILTGGITFLGWLLVCTSRTVIRIRSLLRRFTAGLLAGLKAIKGKKLTKNIAREKEKPAPNPQQPHKANKRLKKHSKALTNSGWLNCNRNDSGCETKPGPDKSVSSENNDSPFNSRKDDRKIAVLLADEKSAEPKESSVAVPDNMSVTAAEPESATESVQKTALLEADGNPPQLDDSVSAQMENLESQVAEFRQMTKTFQQTAVERSEPLNNTLVELTQQVAAIREYASQQQDRVKKLQDGYDWNIIRNFCLRVIRCVDNLEARIARLAGKNIDTAYLEEARDELLFSLESSGVEQFEPEINSDYRGQEKIAEAAKEKEHSDKPNQTGKIAKVLRPGYQYFIDEENVKVVRAAQVKLYS